MRGPIDFIIVKFVGNDFDGGILAALETAVRDGVIAILDLVVVSKDTNGVLATVEVSEFYETLAAEPVAASPSLINQDDIAEVGELLENDSSAGLLIIEQLWARGLKHAIQRAHGELIAEGRIHPEAAAEIDNLEVE
jgi:Family of unknown function (DUF6325)